MTHSDRPSAWPEALPDATTRMTLLGHDLRAAVSDIIGGLRLVSQDGLDEDTRIQLERIRASGEVLALLLEEGLSVMLGEEEFVATHPANVQLGRLIHDVNMRWSGRARELGLGFALSVAPDVPQVLALDRVALERILSNTLSNAMKYSETGTVRLDVDMSAAGALRMTVTDQGPGFSSEAMARLFEYGGRPAGLSQPGSGLGMHITRSMTGRLGGTISVENRPGGGAGVTLELPPESWTVTAEEPEEFGIPDLSLCKVLVAEDNATNRTIIAHMLTRMGATFEIAEDGVEAEAWLESEVFDLALIDIEMPRRSGIDVIRNLRAGTGRNKNLPVIAITAYVLRANRDAIYAAGADAILAKPLAGLETFGMSIAQVLERHGTGAAPAPVMPEDGSAVCDGLEHLLEVAGPEVARELLDRLRTDLQNAERELVAGLAETNIALVRSCTHVLIALAGAVSSVPLQTLAQALNTAAHRRETAGFARMGKETLTHLDRLITLVTNEKIRRGEG